MTKTLVPLGSHNGRGVGQIANAILTHTNVFTFAFIPNTVVGKSAFMCQISRQNWEQVRFSCIRSLPCVSDPEHRHYERSVADNQDFSENAM